MNITTGLVRLQRKRQWRRDIYWDYWAHVRRSLGDTNFVIRTMTDGIATLCAQPVRLVNEDSYVFEQKDIYLNYIKDGIALFDHFDSSGKTTTYLLYYLDKDSIVISRTYNTSNGQGSHTLTCYSK